MGGAGAKGLDDAGVIEVATIGDIEPRVIDALPADCLLEDAERPRLMPQPVPPLGPCRELPGLGRGLDQGVVGVGKPDPEAGIGEGQENSVRAAIAPARVVSAWSGSMKAEYRCGLRFSGRSSGPVAPLGSRRSVVPM